MEKTDIKNNNNTKPILVRNEMSSSYLSYEYVGMILSLGILLATNAINVAHELGHRKSQFEKTLSKILLILFWVSGSELAKSNASIIEIISSII